MAYFMCVKTDTPPPRTNLLKAGDIVEVKKSSWVPSVTEAQVFNIYEIEGMTREEVRALMPTYEEHKAYLIGTEWWMPSSTLAQDDLEEDKDLQEEKEIWKDPDTGQWYEMKSSPMHAWSVRNFTQQHFDDLANPAITKPVKEAILTSNLEDKIKGEPDNWDTPIPLQNPQ